MTHLPHDHPARVCEHGQLARRCDSCELARAEAEIRVLRAEVDAWRAWHDRGAYRDGHVEDPRPGSLHSMVRTARAATDAMDKTPT